MDLRATLNLPDPNFTIPMKAGLPKLEPEIQQRWEEIKLYHRIQEARREAESFVLHDGPPYTNSPIHLGTALNKILKDFVVKSRTMMGFRAPYVPGYDNHGLPIEQAVMKSFEEQGVKPDGDTFRKACRAHASQYIKIQTDQFKRLGVLGLWEKPYATMNFGFEAEIVRVFKRLLENGYVYRGLRSTLWSPTSRTALADTEIVYKEHTSKQIYVRFPLKHDPFQRLTKFENLHTIIWTTTPWTIPANLAVAFHPELMYGVVRVAEVHYLVLEDLIPRLAEVLGWTDFELVGRFQGINFDKVVFKHPVFDRDSLGVMAHYVTTEDGTGVVHTAPGHGRDDFETGKEYGLPILSPVDEKGYLTDDAGEFSGTFYKDCDRVVVERLRALGHLLYEGDFMHQYPHAERDGQPVIFRATEQWFVNIDHEDLRMKMLDEIEKVAWFPPQATNRISAMISGRPDWCISRQRPWGVGIPVLYGQQSGKPVLDPDVIDYVIQVVQEGGSDAWFSTPAEAILPEGYSHPETGETEFRKETDVLDVWFDSGSTSLAVLEGNVEPEWQESWPADLYLEGSDQHRGWFNSSLTIGTAINGSAPYKSVVTHGFVTDMQGRKMSKRLGNVVDPEEACEKYGADILRYWVASVDYENDVPCSDELLQRFGENYRTVRNTLRFLLGNLYDYDPEANPTLMDLDEWVVEQTDLLAAECLENYARYEYTLVINAIHNFCAKELSRFYLDAIKDRMYCDGKDWPSRRSAQKACHYVLLSLTKLLAPILPHTAEEVYHRIPGVDHLPSVHMETFTSPTQERLAEIEASDFQAKFAGLLDYRAQVFAVFEEWKTQNEVKDSQDVIVTISDSPENLQNLRGLQVDLPNYLKMSWVELVDGPPSITFRPSEYLKCERSRLRRPDVELVDGTPLTARDRRALGV